MFHQQSIGQFYCEEEEKEMIKIRAVPPQNTYSLCILQAGDGFGYMPTQWKEISSMQLTISVLVLQWASRQASVPKSGTFNS